MQSYDVMDLLMDQLLKPLQLDQLKSATVWLMTFDGFGHMSLVKKAVLLGPYAFTRPAVKMRFVSMLKRPICQFLKSFLSPIQSSFVPTPSSVAGR